MGRSARARRAPLQEAHSRRTWGCLAVRVSTLRSGLPSRRAWKYHSPFGKFTSSESAPHAVSRPPWRPLRHSFGTETHSRQGISPSARRLIAGLLLTQSPAPWRPLRRAAPPSSTRNPRPRRCAASPSSTRCPTLASSSFISRGRRALSFSYLSTLLPSEPSLLAVFFTPLLWRVSSEPS